MIIPFCKKERYNHDAGSLADLSPGDDSRTWGNLVFSRDQDLSAVGWQDIVPYPKYVDKRTVSRILFGEITPSELRSD